MNKKYKYNGLMSLNRETLNHYLLKDLLKTS